MAAIAEPSAAADAAAAQSAPRLDRAEGVELLGPVSGSGYKEGAALVRRADGQMVQLGPLMYSLLEAADGTRTEDEVAAAMSGRLRRQVGHEHVVKLAAKLAGQGLLAGTEHRAPPRRNPLLALRWKVLVTNPAITRRLTAPFTVLFSPWIMWPALAGFAVVFWFVLIHKGVASATSDAFHSPGLLLLVFLLAVASAGFHELGHASACRYGGATPGGMGMGMYLVWPAFYTDVTDAYRLPKRARLRVDLGGLYFNAVVADLTLAVWLAWRSDALLLLVALQVLQMVKQLSPVIRADGYHILSDATGVPDLYSHMGPTLRRLLPGHRHEPTVLTGWARVLVSAWVIVMVPVLISLSASAILLLPRLMTSAFDSGRLIVSAIPHQVSDGQIIDVLASIVRLLALALPVLGSVLVTQKIVRTMTARARAWSQGQPIRRAILAVVAALLAAALAWAWWPSGQYQPVRANQGGTIGGLVTLVATPSAVARPAATVAAPPSGHSLAGRPALAPGTHLAVSMIPVGGASTRHPALFIVPGAHGRPSTAVVSPTTSGPPAGTASIATTSGPATSATSPATPATTSTTASATSSTPAPSPATAFNFVLPAKPGPGSSQALAVNRTDGGVLYDVAYSLVTVSGGAPVTNTNSAYAFANCRACTTVAVSVQVVLIVGQSRVITPINAAGSLNGNCPACTTTAYADQIVVSLRSAPTAQLVRQLDETLAKLNALPSLGSGGTPQAVTAQVSAVQQQIDGQLAASGLLSQPPTAASASTTATSPTSPSATSATQSATTADTSPTPSDVPGAGTASASSSAATPQTAAPPAATTTSAAPTTTASTTTAPTTAATGTTTSPSAATAAG